MLRQQKLLNIYEYIKDNLYLCNSDIEIQGHRFNSNLLFGLLSSVNNGKQLIMGEYGGGKTTGSEYLLSTIHGIPRDVLVASTLRGNPELTAEKILGRPNLGELNKGIEDVIWSFFVTLEPKIIDEFNRIPENKQNILLQGMDTGHWQYLNEMASNSPYPLFATINYKDSGNTRLVEAALDRFEIAVESKYPGVNNMRMIRLEHEEKGTPGKILEDEESSQKIFQIMLSDKTPTEKKRQIGEISEKFRAQISKKMKIEIPTSDEITEISQDIKQVRISKEANMFLDLAVSELYSCMMFGQKRSDQGCIKDCHYQNLLCGKKQNCDSVRNHFAIIKYAKSLAWLLGDKEVEVSHLNLTMPYNLWHKMRFAQTYLNELKDHTRQDPLALYATKKAVYELVSRFGNYKPELEKMFQLMGKKQYDEAKKLAEHIDHPVFYDYLKIS